LPAAYPLRVVRLRLPVEILHRGVGRHPPGEVRDAVDVLLGHVVPPSQHGVADGVRPRCGEQPLPDCGGVGLDDELPAHLDQPRLRADRLGEGRAGAAHRRHEDEQLAPEFGHALAGLGVQRVADTAAAGRGQDHHVDQRRGDVVQLGQAQVEHPEQIRPFPCDPELRRLIGRRVFDATALPARAERRVVREVDLEGALPQLHDLGDAGDVGGVESLAALGATMTSDEAWPIAHCSDVAERRGQLAEGSCSLLDDASVQPAS